MLPFRSLSCAVVCLAVLSFAGCSSSSSTADFSLAAMPTSVSLNANGTAQFTVTATALNGLSGAIALSLTGLPSGVTSSPANASVMPGSSQTFTLAGAGSVATGTASITVSGTYGRLTHTTTVAIATTALPPADFSLAVNPTSVSVTDGASGSQVTFLATPVNGFSGSVIVAASGVPAGVSLSPSSLTLTPGASQGLSVIAANGAPAGTNVITFTGTSGSLSHSVQVSVTVSSGSMMSATGPDITTYHYDNARDGLNSQESMLTPANVNAASFGLLGNYPVDGKVDAQPLYVGGLKFQTGTEVHTDNALYVATEHDSVYALNAATGAQLWKTSVLGTGETTSDSRNCNQIVPEIGITSTPVIDRTFGPNGAIFVIGMSKDAAGGYHHRLHALDLVLGTELPGSPTEIAATYPGTGANSSNGNVVFDPAQYVERASLLLLNGTIYTGWSSHCDIAPYTGWMMGYSEASLKQTTVLNLTPNGSDGSIWMSGFGIAADAQGNIFVADANGTLDAGFNANGFPSLSDFGNAILKVSTGNGLAVADFFEPYNTVAESNADKDLGSGGVLLLPDLTDSTGTVRHLGIGGGKDGNIYVVDRDNLGKLASGNSNTNVYQELPNANPNEEYGGPAYFNNTIYYGSTGQNLMAYGLTDARLTPTPTSQTKVSFAYPGTTPSVSANGSQNGIVWALESAENGPAVLHAYDATDLQNELYNSTQAPNNRDSFGMGNKFITPVVSNGMVFVGTPNSVAVFGLLGSPSM